MPESPITLVAIVGSLRAASVNRVVFDAAVEVVPDRVTLVEAPVRDLPFYDGDLEAAGEPAAVTALKEAVAGADGVVFFTPEYNRSVPAVTKNALDWASRVPGDSAIGGKPIAIVAAAPGGHEVTGVRTALALTAAGARARPFGESLGIGAVTGLIDDGRLIDESTRDVLAGYLARFVEFVTTPVPDGD